MRNDNDPVKRENKKALPRFILIMVACMAAGVALGLVLVFLDIESFADALDYAGLVFTAKLSPWLLAALPIVELAACLPVYFSAKRQAAAWDGEDEAVSERIEVKLAVCLWITGTANVLDFFLAAAMFSGLMGRVGTEWDMGRGPFFLGLGMFLVTLYVTVVLQQKAVDATKRMNPEKQGSVYDTKFQKKWLESCDEAERAIIGQCALKAYQAMSFTCLILWAVLGLGGMFFDWGFMPAMVVCVVWGVGQSVYAWTCLKMSKPSSPSVY